MGVARLARACGNGWIEESVMPITINDSSLGHGLELLECVMHVGAGVILVCTRLCRLQVCRP